MIKRSFEHTTKYWNIIIEGDEFAVNFGKIGTIGKVQVKSFESDLEFMNEVEKLIRQKVRKGYVESLFDWDNHIYVNDPEVGPSFLTSHPLTGDLKMAEIEAIHRLKQTFEKEDQAIFEEVYERLYTFPTES